MYFYVIFNAELNGIKINLKTNFKKNNRIVKFIPLFIGYPSRNM